MHLESPSSPHLGEGVGHVPPVHVILLPVDLQHLLVLPRVDDGRLPRPLRPLVALALLLVPLEPQPPGHLPLAQLALERLVMLPEIVTSSVKTSSDPAAGHLMCELYFLSSMNSTLQMSHLR
jgi:hypothetical protein